MKSRSRSINKYIKFILLSIILIFIDQFTKILFVNKVGKNDIVVVIKKILSFQYVENTGIAFGIFSNEQIFIIAFAILISIIICYLIKIIEDSLNINSKNGISHYKSFNNKFTFIQLLLIIIVSGSIGNIIDRIRLGYVIDFLKFEFIDFPVFNIADCYVTVSAVILLITLMFFIKENELELIKFRK